MNLYSYNLFVQGTDQQLWRKFPSSSGEWTSGGWVTLAGAPSEPLSASSPASTNIVANEHTLVCVSTTSGNIWYSADSLENWLVWGSVGTPS